MTKTKRRPVTFAQQLRGFGACNDAVEWVGKKSLTTAWRTCERADWMLWLLSKCDGWSRDALSRCLIDFMADALESARAVAGKESYWHAVEAAHRQVRDAIEGRGDLSAAASAARSAAWSAARSAARSAVWSAASAAASAAESAASAAESAAWSAAESAARSRHADIVRRHFPKPPKLAPGAQAGEARPAGGAP